MAEIGYTLSSEEHGPKDLVRYARRAEEAGFTFAVISDHFHPWIDRQGNSPYAWTVLGGIAEATTQLTVGTGVTCPTIRYNPAIVAQAAATIAAMMPGRFFLGVGTGENLNEHIAGAHWPSHDVRRSMLEEAVEVIRLLWRGEWVDYHGAYYTIENARIYTLPERLPPIAVAASGPKSAVLAGRIGDALVGLAPDQQLLKKFDAAGGTGKPKYGQLKVCWAATEQEARRVAFQWWPTTVLGGELGEELRLPQHFQSAIELVTESEVARNVVCGPDAERHIGEIRKFLDAGYDHVYIHQIGPDQEGFFRFYEREILPKVHKSRSAGS